MAPFVVAGRAAFAAGALTAGEDGQRRKSSGGSYNKGFTGEFREAFICLSVRIMWQESSLLASAAKQYIRKRCAELNRPWHQRTGSLSSQAALVDIRWK